MQLLLVPDFPALPQPGRKCGLQLQWATTWLRLPSALDLSLPLPEDLPALTAHMLRECQLHIGGPVPRTDLQELWRENGWMVGQGGGQWASNTLSSLSLRGGLDSLFPTSFWTIPSFCSECGANSLPTYT